MTGEDGSAKGEGTPSTGVDGGRQERSSGEITVESAAGTRSGRAVDVADVADLETVVAAVRNGTGSGQGSPGGSGVSVDCARPQPVHEHVGVVRRETSLRARTALAAAARSRGATTPQDGELQQVRAALADLSVPDGGDTTAARQRLAGTESAVAAQRERVAALRGRIQAGREAGRDVSDLRTELADATRELSERETERAAAEEALERAERQAREARDARERRRRLRDREANLEREARRALVETFRDEYAAAVETVPAGTAGAESPFDVDGVTAALAVARVADLRAPVVLACDRFESPESAADWLDAPVIRV